MSSPSKCRKFYELLGELKEHVGNRNGMLTKVVATGLASGMSPDDVADAFAKADTGDPHLSSQEVARAIARSKEYLSGEANTNPARFERSYRQVEQAREMATATEKSFVERMMAVGLKRFENSANFARNLHEISPWKSNGFLSVESRLGMAEHYVRTLFDDDEYLFATDNIHAERDESRIYHPKDLVEFLKKYSKEYECGGKKAHKTAFSVSGDLACYSRTLPTHMGINAVTGTAVKTSTGKMSYATKKTLKRRNHALVEFDMMPIRDQVLFWIGAVTSGELDVVTIVFTCNKSLHGVVNVREATDDDLFGEVTDLAAEQQWKREWQRLARVCCSNDDVTMRCDLSALKDAARMTRFAGGLRDHGLPMPLVWSK